MAKVLKDFRCKVTKRVYRTGDEYDGDRAEELHALGYVNAGETDGGAAAEPAEKPVRKRKRDDSG
jgi:hypothetical protein